MHASTVAVVFAVLVAAAIAAPNVEFGGHGYGHGHGHHGHDYYAHPKYQYTYGVNDKHTGDYKTAHEYRDGGITKGSYSVLQPDGVLRTVNYVVDPKGGFQAQVLNKGVAHHDGGHHGHHGGHGYAHGHGHHGHGVGHGFGHGGYGYGH